MNGSPWKWCKFPMSICCNGRVIKLFSFTKYFLCLNLKSLELSEWHVLFVTYFWVLSWLQRKYRRLLLWTRIASVITILQLLGAVFLLFTVTNLLHHDTASNNCLRGNIKLYACLFEIYLSWAYYSRFYMLYCLWWAPGR